MVNHGSRSSLVVVAICALYVLANASGQKVKKPSRTGFEIVFENRLNSSELNLRSEDMDIFVMDQLGGHVRRLTSDHKSHSPALSPDGKQIAYLSDDQPLLPDPHSRSTLEAFYKAMQRPQSLLRMNADGKMATKIASVGPEAQGVVWLPDNGGIGLRISDRKDLNVYLNHGKDWDSPFDRVDTVSGILKDGEERASKSPTWLDLFSPVGSNYLPAFLLHTGNVGVLTKKETYAPASRMHLAPDVKASLSTVLFDGKAGDPSVTAYDAAWSQDGRHVAYSKFLGSKGSKLFAAEFENGKTTNTRALTRSSLDAHDPAWSADGKRLALEGIWKGSQQIFVVNADGSGLLSLSHNALMNCAHPSWSPDGNWIVAECKGRLANSNFPSFPFFELGEWYSSIYLFNVNKPTAAPRALVDCGTNIGEFPDRFQSRCGAHNPSFVPVGTAQ